MAQTQTTRKFDPSTATREELIARNCKLEQIIVKLKGQLEELANLAADFYWLDRLISNPSFNGNEKTVLYGSRKVAAKREPREDGYVQVYREDIAKETGLSEQTVGTTLKKLAEHDIIGRKTEPVRDKDTGKISKNLLIHLPPKIMQDSTIQMELKEDEETWGGKRIPLCPNCKSPNLLEKHSYVCMNPACGCRFDVDEALMVSEEALAKDAELQEDLKEIAAQKEAAAAGYPDEIQAMMDAQGIHRLDHRACLICNHNEWLPANLIGGWHYLCGYCHPFLLASQGRDIREREGIA